MTAKLGGRLFSKDSNDQATMRAKLDELTDAGRPGIVLAECPCRQPGCKQFNLFLQNAMISTDGVPYVPMMAPDLIALGEHLTAAGRRAIQ
jgi:hypothetical protein